MQVQLDLLQYSYRIAKRFCQSPNFKAWPLLNSDILSTHSKSPKPQKPREKQMRVWGLSGSSDKNLDYSGRNGDGSQNGGDQNQEAQHDPVYTRSPPFQP